jgi:uncharacterized protein YdeI (YjbR/CyaY-like superfamily)
LTAKHAKRGIAAVEAAPAQLVVQESSMTTDDKTANLKRPLHPMPDDVATALAARGLLSAYQARPAYQQNDYIGWISRAKRPETRTKRLQQMLDELARGGVYMNMQHTPSAR